MNTFASPSAVTQARTVPRTASNSQLDEWYAALARRDAAYDGVFFVGVRTTGVFCRPSCTAKKPRRENVEFFESAAAALAGGYRACLRCRPLEPAGSPPAWVRVLAEEVDRVCAPLADGRLDRNGVVDRSGRIDRNGRIDDKALRARGLEPATVRRQFLRTFGVTFQAYQRARRLGVALERVKNGGDLLGVAFDAGFESDSGFRSAFKRLFGGPPGRVRAAARDDGTSDAHGAARGPTPESVDPIVATLIHTPIGAFVAAANAAGVCLFDFADRPAILSQTKSLRRWFAGPVIPGRSAHLEALRQQLDEYFAGRRREFSLPLATAGTPFQLAVWRRLREIPYGETRSYEQIAQEIGRAGAQRAVGKANGDNRLAILIPCHRVVQKDGQLRGYGGGLWRKRWLLEHERRHVS